MHANFYALLSLSKMHNIKNYNQEVSQVAWRACGWLQDYWQDKCYAVLLNIKSFKGKELRLFVGLRIWYSMLSALWRRRSVMAWSQCRAVRLQGGSTRSWLHCFLSSCFSLFSQSTTSLKRTDLLLSCIYLPNSPSKTITYLLSPAFFLFSSWSLVVSSDLLVDVELSFERLICPAKFSNTAAADTKQILI